MTKYEISRFHRMIIEFRCATAVQPHKDTAQNLSLQLCVLLLKQRILTNLQIVFSRIQKKNQLVVETELFKSIWHYYM